MATIVVSPPNERILADDTQVITQDQRPTEVIVVEDP